MIAQTYLLNLTNENTGQIRNLVHRNKKVL